MTRQKAIIWSLIGLLTLLLWDFGNRALFYHPLAVSGESTRPATPEKEEGKPGLKTTWGVEIEQKNLFSESRAVRISPADAAFGFNTAPMQDAAANGPPVEVRPNIILSGIIINQFGEYVAYLKFDGQEPVGIRKGETVEGVKVISLDERSVSLDWKGSGFELTLSNQPLIKR